MQLFALFSVLFAYLAYLKESAKNSANNCTPETTKIKQSLNTTSLKRFTKDGSVPPWKKHKKLHRQVHNCSPKKAQKVAPPGPQFFTQNGAKSCAPRSTFCHLKKHKKLRPQVHIFPTNFCADIVLPVTAFGRAFSHLKPSFVIYFALASSPSPIAFCPPFQHPGLAPSLFAVSRKKLLFFVFSIVQLFVLFSWSLLQPLGNTQYRYYIHT